MSRKHLARLLLLGCAFSPLANASILDMNSFVLVKPAGSGAELHTNEAYLDPGAQLINSVTGLTSFQWNFLEYDPALVYVRLSLPASAVTDVVLADSFTVGNSGSTGWLTYVFATPYTGYFSIKLDSPLDAATVIQLRNFSDTPIASSPTIPAVPEPESYAMLLAGLGLVASVARRRARRTVSAPVREAMPA